MIRWTAAYAFWILIMTLMLVLCSCGPEKTSDDPRPAIAPGESETS